MRLRDLDLLPIKERFLTSDLLLFYDIYNNISCVELPSYLKNSTQEQRTRLRSSIKPPKYYAVNESLKFQVMRQSRNDSFSLKCEIEPKSLAFRSSFFFRTMLEWNCLPSEIKESPSKAMFREKLLLHVKNNVFKVVFEHSESELDSQIWNEPLN